MSSGLREKEVNLDISFRVKDLLRNEGAEVIMTRTGDDARSLKERWTACNQQSADILVSVHNNSVANTSVNGSLTLYYKQEDKALAQAVYDVMFAALKTGAPDPASFTSFGVRPFDGGVLINGTMPAVIVESVFLSNPEEAELLKGNPRRTQIAQVIYQGIVEYYNRHAPRVAEAWPPLVLQLTSEVEGDNVVYTLWLRNRSQYDLKSLDIKGLVPAGGRVVDSWAGRPGEHRGVYDGQAVGWYNEGVPAKGTQGPFVYVVSGEGIGESHAWVGWRLPVPGSAVSESVVP